MQNPTPRNINTSDTQSSEHISDNKMSPDPTIDDRVFYWDWYKHEENLFTNRGSFFLVAESMLFAAVATLRAATQSSATTALPVFYGLGILVTVIWLGVSIFHHSRTRTKVQTKLNKVEERRRDISSAGSFWLRSHFLMGVIMPLGILVAWLFLAKL